MSFLINALTAVFGKPKYDSSKVTVFSPGERAQHTAMIEDASEEYHWRIKEDCASCNKHRVAMRVPQYHDFGHHNTVFICASCSKSMYGISRYLFNTIAEQSDYLKMDTWAKNNYLNGE